MSLGAALYGYRSNFNCKKANTRKGKSTRIKLINLIIDGYRTVSKYDDDYFISIAQYFLKKGYIPYYYCPDGFIVSEDTSLINKFFMYALFSINPFYYESLIINRDFDVFEWRKQFDMFSEIKLTGLNFYRNRASMPLENWTSLQDIYRKIYRLSKNEEYKLNFSFNSCHKDAVWIMNRYCRITDDRFYYTIIYGCRDDYENKLAGTFYSNWKITIESEIDENYVDFCLRIYNNYDAIISGSKDVLISSHLEEENFCLGGRFKLRNNSIENSFNKGELK